MMLILEKWNFLVNQLGYRWILSFKNTIHLIQPRHGICHAYNQWSTYTAGNFIRWFVSHTVGKILGTSTTSGPHSVLEILADGLSLTNWGRSLDIFSPGGVLSY